MPEQMGTGDECIVAKCSGTGFPAEPSIMQQPASAIIIDKLGATINTELRAVRASQAELTRHLMEWMNNTGDVLSEVRSQHQALQTMISEVAGRQRNVSCATAVLATSLKHREGTAAHQARAKAQQDAPIAESASIATETAPRVTAIVSEEDEPQDTIKAQPATHYSPYGRAVSYDDELERIAKMREKINRQARKTQSPMRVVGKITEKGFCQSLAQSVVESITFDLLFACLIIANAILIGAEVEYKTTSEDSAAFDTVIVVAQYFFCMMFMGEFATRMIAAGLKHHFLGPEWSWSWFDATMVCVSVVEVIDSLSADRDGDDVGSHMLRIVRMARLARIVRVLRFSPQLMVMVFMIIESAKNLVYALVLLAIILYVFSICFTIGATDYLKEVDTYDDTIKKHYGSLFRSIYTLYKSVTGGQSWGELCEPVFDLGAFYTMIFIFWISFSVLAVLNVVTGFFVDGALAKSALDRDLMAEKEMARKRAVVQTLKQLFRESDTDQTGTIEEHEFVQHLKDERVSACLAALKIDTTHLQDLFLEIDADGSGTIDMREFVENMQQVMGASGLDQNVQRLVMESREAGERWRAFVKDMKDEFSEMNVIMNDLIVTIPDMIRDVTVQLRQKDRKSDWTEDVPPTLDKTGSVSAELRPNGVTPDLTDVPPMLNKLHQHGLVRTASGSRPNGLPTLPQWRV